MFTAVRRLVRSERFDVVHADQLWMAQYALAAKASSPQVRLILDQHNAVHLIPRRLAGDTANPLKKAFLGHEARALAGYETEVCQRFDHVVWVTAEDRQAVSALSEGVGGDSEASTVIPICTDTDLVEAGAACHKQTSRDLSGRSTLAAQCRRHPVVRKTRLSSRYVPRSPMQS